MPGDLPAEFLAYNYPTYPITNENRASGSMRLKGKEFGQPNGSLPFASYIYHVVLNQPTQWAISSTASNQPADSNIWKTVRRAFLRIPFGEYSDPEHVRKFRMLMDGVQDGRKALPTDNSPFYMKNPELTTTGAANMASAIFFPDTPTGGNDRADLITSKLVYYSHKNKEVTRYQDDTPGAQSNAERGIHAFAKGSRETSGTVIDFFSPAVGLEALTIPLRTATTTAP